MVKYIFSHSRFLIITGVFLLTTPVSAELSQTRADLAKGLLLLEARISDSQSDEEVLLPLAIIRVVPYYDDTASVLHDLVINAFTGIFDNEVLVCQSCNQQQIINDGNGTIRVQWGNDYSTLKKFHPQLQKAQSFVIVKELPMGLLIQLIAADSGKILYSTIADSTQSVSSTPLPQHNLITEIERRRRGDGLSHVHLNLTLYQPTAQIEWADQWGSHNQFMTAVGAFVGEFGINGGVTQYLILPNPAGLAIGLYIGYGIKTPDTSELDAAYDSIYEYDENGNALDVNGAIIPEKNLTSPSDIFGLNAEIRLMYPISDNYGVCITAGTSTFGIGISLFNSMFFPIVF